MPPLSETLNSQTLKLPDNLPRTIGLHSERNIDRYYNRGWNDCIDLLKNFGLIREERLPIDLREIDKKAEGNGTIR